MLPGILQKEGKGSTATGLWEKDQPQGEPLEDFRNNSKRNVIKLTKQNGKQDGVPDIFWIGRNQKKNTKHTRRAKSYNL